jgi:hypothetical protein
MGFQPVNCRRDAGATQLVAAEAPPHDAVLDAVGPVGFQDVLVAVIDPHVPLVAEPASVRLERPGVVPHLEIVEGVIGRIAAPQAHLPGRHGPGVRVRRPGPHLGAHGKPRAGGDAVYGPRALGPRAAVDLVDKLGRSAHVYSGAGGRFGITILAWLFSLWFDRVLACSPAEAQHGLRAQRNVSLERNANYHLSSLDHSLDPNCGDVTHPGRLRICTWHKFIKSYDI